MTTAIEKVRSLIDDNLKKCIDTGTYTNLNVFTLTEPNVSEATIVVYKNGVEIGSGDWSYNSYTSKITITGLSVNDQIEIRYSAYKKYSDTELEGFVKSAISYISINRYKTFEINNDVIEDAGEAITTQEYHLIALVASILIDGSIRSYRTPEITITFAQDESKEERIRKVVLNFVDRSGSIDWIRLGEEEEYE